MKLRALSREVVRLADTEFLVELKPDSDALSNYEIDVSRDVSLENLDDVMSAWRAHLKSGESIDAEHDGQMARAIRAALVLSPAEAADQTVWWWLAVVKYPDIALARWNRGGQAGLRERMLGTCGRNAFARLWWGAELVRNQVGLVEQVFKNQDLFEAVIGRKLGRLPMALEAVLERLADKRGKPARETVRDLQQVLSVVVLEALDKDELGQQIDELWEGIRADA